MERAIELFAAVNFLETSDDRRRLYVAKAQRLMWHLVLLR